MVNMDIRINLYNKIKDKADKDGIIEYKKALSIIAKNTIYIKNEIFDDLVKKNLVNPIDKKQILKSIIKLGLLKRENRDKLKIKEKIS